MEDKYEELLKEVDELAQIYDMTLPGWFREFFDYLFKKNQVIMYFDEDTNELDGFICYWKYGKNRRKWIKDMNFLKENKFKQMTKGKNVYIPIALSRENGGPVGTVFDAILKRNKDIDSITWHTTDGQFIIHKTRSK